MFNNGYLLVVLATIGFSLKSILAKLAMFAGAETETVIALRSLMSLPIFIAALWLFEGKASFKVAKEERFQFLRIGLFGFAATMIFSYYCVEYLPANIATLLGHSYPAFTLILLQLTGQRISGSDWVSLVIILAGIGLISRIDTFGSSSIDGLGVALGLLSAVTFAYYNVGVAPILKNNSALRINGLVIFIASTVTGFPFLNFPLPGNAEVYLYVGSISFVCSFLALLAFYEGLKRIGAAKAVLVGSLGPVFSVLFAFLFLGESLDSLQATGALFIVLGVVVVKTKNSIGLRLKPVLLKVTGRRL